MEIRDKLLIESLNDIDITPTMEKNAREKYKAISEYLNGHDLESDFYPQGSFLLGTVVKPYRDGKDKNYDLDILVLLKLTCLKQVVWEITIFFQPCPH